MLHPVVGQIVALPFPEQRVLYGELAPWLRAMERVTQGAATLDEVREARFAKRLKCPRCHSTHVKRNGRCKDKRGSLKQRYICHGCGRGFNDLTGTPLAYSKKQHLWGKLARCLVEAKSVRKTAKELGISVPTSFHWRHKMLGALRSLDTPVLAGVVEADETYVLYSEKGSRQLNRPARKRGGKAAKRGLSREQVCIIVAQDRQENAIAEIGGLGSPSLASIRQVLAPAVRANSTLCTDGAAPYKRFCKEKGIQYCRVDQKKRLRGSIYHFNHVNNWHKRFIDWYVVDLRGVATKYLAHYTTWFVLRDRGRKMGLISATRQLLQEACSVFPSPQAA